MLSSRVSQRIQAVSQFSYKPMQRYMYRQRQQGKHSEAVEGARDFLNGKNKKLLDRLKSLMDEAAEKMEYEEAAVYRDYIEAGEGAVSDSAGSHTAQQGYRYRDTGKGNGRDPHGAVFRQGRKAGGRESYEMEASFEEDSGELISAFINQHYSELPNFPKRYPDADAGRQRAAGTISVGTGWS